jgi:hypothetical protein
MVGLRPTRPAASGQKRTLERWAGSLHYNAGGWLSEMRVSRVSDLLKVIGALLLVACLALPMKSCTGYEDPAGKPVIVGADGVPAPGARSVTERYYLWDELHAHDPVSWLRVAVFLGPAAAVIFTRRRPNSRAAKALWLMEPVLLAGVVYSLWHMWYMNFPVYSTDVGWYVASAGAASYFAGWLGQAYQRWCQWRRQRRPEA